MKTAKEWAESVVPDPEQCSAWCWTATIRDGLDGVRLVGSSGRYYTQEQVDVARGIIERLVERAQADASAPLEEVAAHREAYVAGLQREVNEWRKVACDRGRVLGDVADALEELRRAAVPGSTAEDICERLPPKIDEALR